MKPLHIIRKTFKFENGMRPDDHLNAWLRTRPAVAIQEVTKLYASSADVVSGNYSAIEYLITLERQ